MTKVPNDDELKKAVEEHLLKSQPTKARPNIKLGEKDLASTSNTDKLLKKNASEEWQIVHTYNFEVVQRLCHDTQKHKMLNALIGEPGLGKSTALEYYSQHMKNVYKVTYNITMRPKDLFSGILKSMGVEFNGSIHANLLTLCDELRDRKNSLIIIDESDKMRVPLFNYIHALWNEVRGFTGILFSGVPAMKERIEVASSKHKQGIEEFKSRVMHWEHLALPIRQEIKDICTANDINDAKFIKEAYKSINFREVYNRYKVWKIEDEI